jgi:4-amino-4-deoxy-L-arabinose transferase-like glycosyltransferase
VNEALSQFARRDDRAANALRCLFLVVLCLAAFLPGIFALPPTDRDESRYVQATRQMVETGDYIDIRLQENPRYLQPVGIYWLQSAAIAVSGKGAAAPIWVNRTVSVFGATIAVLAAFFAGRRIFGPAIGFLGAVGLAGIVMLDFEARIAKTDAALLGVTMIAMAALAHVYLGVRQKRPTPLAPFVFWIAFGVGTMIKGPITPALTLLTMLGLCIADRNISWLKRLRPLIGILIAAAICLPWLIAINIRSDGEFLRIALGRSMLSKIRSGQESHGFPPGYYLVLSTAFLWPFALQAVRGGLKALNVGRLDPRITFCLAWIIPYWLVYELIPTKLPHYVLPTYPALMLLAVWSLIDPVAEQIRYRPWQVWVERLAIFGWALVTLAIAGAALVGPRIILGHWSAWGLLAAMLALLAGWFGSGFRPVAAPLPRLLVATLASSAVFGIATQAILPRAESLWLGKVIAESFHANKQCPDSVLASVGFHEPSLVVQAGTKTVLTDAAGAARHLDADPACAVSAVQADSEPAFFAALQGGPESVEVASRVEALDYTKGVVRQITLYRRTR